MIWLKHYQYEKVVTCIKEKLEVEITESLVGVVQIVISQYSGRESGARVNA